MGQNRQAIMKDMMMAYGKAPHHIINDVGGWSRKHDLFQGYGAMTNKSSKAGWNNSYNLVRDAWEETQEGKWKFARPLVNWYDVADDENFANLNMVSIGSRMLMQMQAINKTLKQFSTDFLQYGDKLKNELEGVHSDVVKMLHDNEELITELIMEE